MGCERPAPRRFGRLMRTLGRLHGLSAPYVDLHGLVAPYADSRRLTLARGALRGLYEKTPNYEKNGSEATVLRVSIKILSPKILDFYGNFCQKTGFLQNISIDFDRNPEFFFQNSKSKIPIVDN